MATKSSGPHDERHEFRREVPALPSSVGLLRDLAAIQLAKWGVAEDVIDDVTLVVSELATNSVAACPGQIITLELYTLPGGVVAEVWDPSSVPPVLRTAGEDATDGRGLAIVAALAERWGTRHPPTGGKSVWALFRRP